MTTCGRCLFNGALLTTECSRCVRTRDKFVDRFERELHDAKQEVARLSELFKDVCWYNFETKCRNWGHPWRKSDPNSAMMLQGHHYEHYFNRGHLRESARFPIYYEGTVAQAPCLPPQIVLTELKAAADYMQACESQVTAPYDWAPGGAKYEALRRTTQVGDRKRKFSSGVSSDGGQG